MQFICYRGCLHFLCWCEHHPRKHSIRPLTLLMIALTNTPKDKSFSMCTSLKKKNKKKNRCLGDVARYDSQNIVATVLGHCFEWLQHCSNIATLCCAKNRSCKSSRVTSPLSPCERNKKLKVMLQGTIRNDDFYCNTELQCWNNVVTIRNNVATMLQRCVALKIVVANRLV